LNLSKNHQKASKKSSFPGKRKDRARREPYICLGNCVCSKPANWLADLVREKIFACRVKPLFLKLPVRNIPYEES
jgi:hypothetical protein